MSKYELKNGQIIKDGHTMFLEDVVAELNRKAHLETVKCPLYVEPEKSCQENKHHEMMLNRGK